MKGDEKNKEKRENGIENLDEKLYSVTSKANTLKCR